MDMGKLSKVVADSIKNRDYKNMVGKSVMMKL